MSTLIRVVDEDAAQQLDSVRDLFREYQDFLGVSLCFQSFEGELAALPGKYSASRDGCLYLAEKEGSDVGCVAFYRVDDSTCELKRLFVRPQFHQHGIGRSLLQRAISDAEKIGYRWMILDSLARLKPACELYRSLGFSLIDPYNENPHDDVLYFRKLLA